MKTPVQTPLQTLFLLLALAAVPTAAVAGGGTIVKLDGSAVIERKATRVAAAESTPIYSGDTLNVSQGTAQVRFEDDSLFVVPGAARLRVDKFTLPKGGAGGSAVYTLVDGGLRTITGTVGKGSGDQYELRTEEATITVAGSAYMAIRCQGACAKKYKAGLYVRGESGAVFMTTTAGRLKVKRSQTGYSANSGALPVHVRVSPFDDPLIAAEFGISLDFDTEVHPPRIEQEAPASPA